MLAPGLGKVRTYLADASAGWVVAAVALEALSCVSYVLLFRPVFCPRMSWRTSFEIGCGVRMPATTSSPWALTRYSPRSTVVSAATSRAPIKEAMSATTEEQITFDDTGVLLRALTMDLPVRSLLLEASDQRPLTLFYAPTLAK